MTATGAAHAAAAAAARDGYGRLVALLAAGSGDLQAAEDALGDALERALRTWPDDGVPDNPAGWLLTVARRRLRDRQRSAEVRRTTPLAPERHAPVRLEDVDPDAVGDRRLELMLVCAHPAVDPVARTPLMLTTVLGFTAAQVAPAFSVPAATMATRLVRAKRRIRDAGVPFTIPDRSVLPGRMADVLEAVYGAYVVEWSTAASEPRRLPSEALRLAEVLAQLQPDDPEVRGLAALVLLSSARAGARTDALGRFVPLTEQDPARWDADAIAQAHAHLRAAHARGTLGRFQLEAAVQAMHCARRPGEPPDWPALLRLHDALQQVAPSLGGAVARAAVVAETAGPAAGLAALDTLGDRAARFQPAWAVRADLLARLGHATAAAAAFDRAASLTSEPALRSHLDARRSALLRSAPS
ncbi:RNA polymerase sigma factor [Isoptericola sp. NPDC057191]|uniref:RNA polymerase sigma factor n=1 Tax=Isoptericola sp. NPDC057191 TaxID=3346041 RepID=UPI003635BD4B